ncbi:MAG: Crp/Fnr family transcriptional regulator [Caulobacteraceae bacterium]
MPEISFRDRHAGAVIPMARPAGIERQASRCGGLAPLAVRLARFAPLSEAERGDLTDLPHMIERLVAGQPIVTEGERPADARLLLEGWAVRHKSAPGARRQVLAFVMPGELCDADGAVFGRADHGVRALTAVTIALIPSIDFLSLIGRHRRIGEALWSAARIDHGITRAWLVNLGQRRAHERIAHLLSEIAHRARTAGLAPLDGSIEAPLTQQELADAVGLTSVHVNRVLQRLRAGGAIESRKGLVVIRDVAALEKIAAFDPAYLGP